MPAAESPVGIHEIPLSLEPHSLTKLLRDVESFSAAAEKWCQKRALPIAHAHQALKAFTPRSVHCSANGYELRIRWVGSRWLR